MNVLININEMDVVDYITEKENANKHGISKDYSFINSELYFEKMKLDHKNIFVDGNNYNLDVLIEMVKNLKPYKITHLKIEGKIYYKTIFQNESKLILVDGPLTSGYGGQGPSEFAKLLSNLGFDDDILEKYIFTKLGDACIETTFILAENV